MNNRTMALNPRRACKPIILATLWLMFWTTLTATAGPIITIEPAEPTVGSCLAFGAGPGSGNSGGLGGAPGFLGTSPYMGMIYQNIPAFDLNPGDILAFDLGAVNDFDVEIDIEMAATTANGETTESGPFQKVVSNTYVPLKPRGDTVVGNFDLRFVVDNAYSFPGDGLIIRFSNGSDAYRDDLTCDQVGVIAMSTDTSGNFVQAFWSDEDGVSPWEPGDPPIPLQLELLNGFQIIEGPTVLLASDTLDVSDTPITATPVGETITLRVNAQNPGGSEATSVVVTVTLDDAVGFTQATSNPPVVTVFDAGPPATVQWPVNSLAAGEEATLEVDVEVLIDAGSQTISNVAEVTAADAPYKTGLSDQSDVIVEPAIDITGELLDPSGDPITSIQAGEPFVYRIAASNSSQLDGTGVEVKVTLPENIVFQQADATPPATIAPDPGPPETVVWTVGDLLSGQDATLDIDLIASFAASSATLSGMAALTEPSQSDDVLTNMVVEPAISIESRTLDADGASASTAMVGEVVSYEIVVTNLSEVDATGLEMTATLAENLEFLQSTPTPAAGTAFDIGPPATLVWEIDTLAAGAGTEAILIVDMDVPFSASGQSASNSVELTASDAQALLGGGASSDISIDDAIALTVSSRDTGGTAISSADIGDSFVYQIVVNNSGKAAATGLEMTATLAGGIIFNQATPATGVTVDAGPPATVTWNLGSLPGESEAMLDIDLDINFAAGGLVINNATEITGADAELVVGLTAESEVTVSNTGADLLNGGSGNCFIATAAYGSYLEPEVMVLRNFRDKYLLTNEPGRVFVDWYYQNSPNLAARIADNEPARIGVRLLLSPVVYAVKYPLPTLLSLLFIGLIGQRRRTARTAR